MQSRQFFRAFLVVGRLAGNSGVFARFLLRRAGVGCCPLQAGSVGRLSGHLFPGVGCSPFVELTWRGEFQRHPFSDFALNSRTLALRSSARLPGSLGLFSRLPLALDSLGGIRPAACSAVAESQHIPELLGSLTRPRPLRNLVPLPL